jgi:hypothetical protein
VYFLERNLHRRPAKWRISREQFINKYPQRILITGKTNSSLNLFWSGVDHSITLSRFHTAIVETPTILQDSFEQKPPKQYRIVSTEQNILWPYISVQ